MTKERKPRDEEEILERIYQAFADTSAASDECARETLTAAGIDVGDLAREGLDLVKMLSRKREFAKSRERFDRFREAMKGLDLSAEHAATDIKEAIAHAIQGRPEDQLVQAYFRKLESIEPDDLRSLEDDARLLDLWERLEEGSEDGHS